jgi:plastocyanin
MSSRNQRSVCVVGVLAAAALVFAVAAGARVSPFELASARTASAGYHQIDTALAAGYTGVVTDTAGTTGSAGVRQVESLDACDPATFNDPTSGPGPGTCNRPGGGVKFSDFVGQLLDKGQAPAWRFSPGELTLASGGTLQVANRGGEDHTFTEVASFGGGCVDVLNGILGLSPVPECSIPGLFDSTLVEEGDTLEVKGMAPGVHRFECLIHPWMRATVTVG